MECVDPAHALTAVYARQIAGQTTPNAVAPPQIPRVYLDLRLQVGRGWLRSPPLVERRVRPYVQAVSRRLLQMPDRAISSLPSHIRASVWAGAGIVGALTAATGLLWAHYGSAVFFETIMAGLAFCF
jgi:hypothetical protein